MIKLAQTILLIATIVSCGDSSKTTSQTMQPSDSIESDGACIAEKIQSPQTILTQSMVESLVSPGQQELDKSVSENNKRSEWNSVEYRWDTGRKFTTQGMTLSATNIIALSDIEIVKADDPIADFKTTYKVPTAEEREALTLKMTEQLKAKLDAGEITQEQFEISKGFTGVFSRLNYQPIDEKVGDIAVWDATKTKLTPASQGTLIVQFGKVRFQINVDVGGEDDSASQSMAIKIAQKIIQSCT